jgi:hypothetical protein
LQQIVTLTGFETKTGSNDNGGWTLYLFKDGGGNKYQTFEDDLGSKASGLIGKSVDVEYEVQERDLPAKGDRPATTVRNNVIKSVKEATGLAAQHVVVQQAVNGTAGNRSDFQRSKEEVRRTAAIQTAATLIASPNWEGNQDIPTLVQLAEQVAVYAENGAEAFATAEVTY